MDIKEEHNEFFHELDGRGFIFQNKNWLGGCFEDDQLQVVWEMWSSAKHGAKAQAVPEFPVMVFDEWFRNRHEKTGLYEEALCGKDDATYIRHEMRKAFQAGWKEKQAVPEGFVLVPKEPTEKHLQAIYDNKNSTANAYRAIIKAQEQSHD